MTDRHTFLRWNYCILHILRIFKVAQTNCKKETYHFSFNVSDFFSIFFSLNTFNIITRENYLIARQLLKIMRVYFDILYVYIFF